MDPVVKGPYIKYHYQAPVENALVLCHGAKMPAAGMPRGKWPPTLHRKVCCTPCSLSNQDPASHDTLIPRSHEHGTVAGATNAEKSFTSILQPAMNLSFLAC